LRGSCQEAAPETTSGGTRPFRIAFACQFCRTFGVTQLAPSPKARASRRDDLDELRPRIARAKTTASDCYGLASKWFSEAINADKVNDESAARARLPSPLLQKNVSTNPVTA
jgi:hypothetical protein